MDNVQKMSHSFNNISLWCKFTFLKFGTTVPSGDERDTLHR
jgi:hypothetical protein